MKKIIITFSIFLSLLIVSKSIFAYTFFKDLLLEKTSNKLQENITLGSNINLLNLWLPLDNEQKVFIRKNKIGMLVGNNATQTDSFVELQSSSTPTLYVNNAIYASSTSLFDKIKVYGNATSTLALHGTEVCIANDCRTVWPTSGTGGSAAWEKYSILSSPANIITPTTTNASIFVSGNATTTGSLTVVGLGGSGDSLKVDANGLIYRGTDATGASAGAAWEQKWLNAITPTTTGAGIFVTASSTIQGSLRVDGNATTTGSFSAGQLLVGNTPLNISNWDTAYSSIWGNTQEQNFWNATTSWAYYDTNWARNANGTTTQTNFKGQFDSLYNATTTQTNFLQNWNTLHNATTTYPGFATQFASALNATNTWAGFQSEFNNKTNASTTINNWDYLKSKPATSTVLNLLDTQKRISVINATTTNADILKVYTNSTLADATSTHLAVSTLTNCNTVDTDASGTFICGTDATGSGGSAAWEKYTGLATPANIITPTTTNASIFVSGSATTTASMSASEYLIGTAPLNLDNIADGVSYERVGAAELSGGIYKDATIAVKGIASFSDSYFSVSSGAVSIDDIYLRNDASDTTSGGLTMNSATTTDSLSVGGKASSTSYTINGLFTVNNSGNATSSHFGVTEVCIQNSCRTTWPTSDLGSTQAWDLAFTGAIKPTTTATGIFVNSSSTISILRVSNSLNASTTGIDTLTVNTGSTFPANDISDAEVSNTLTCSDLQSASAVVDISTETNLTAGDALTLTDDDIDFDGGASPGGSLGGTWASPTIDDLFVLNTTDIMSGGLTMSSATTTDTFSIGTYLQMATAGDNFIYFDNAKTEYISWDDSPGEFDFTDDLNVSGNVTSTAALHGLSVCINNDCKTAWPAGGGAAGQNGAWETFATGVLRPTSTANAILINSSTSTITNLKMNNSTTTNYSIIGSNLWGAPTSTLTVVGNAQFTGVCTTSHELIARAIFAGNGGQPNTTSTLKVVGNSFLDGIATTTATTTVGTKIKMYTNDGTSTIEFLN